MLTLSSQRRLDSGTIPLDALGGIIRRGHIWLRGTHHLLFQIWGRQVATPPGIRIRRRQYRPWRIRCVGQYPQRLNPHARLRNHRQRSRHLHCWTKFWTAFLRNITQSSHNSLLRILVRPHLLASLPDQDLASHSWSSLLKWSLLLLYQLHDVHLWSMPCQWRKLGPHRQNATRRDRSWTQY